MCGLISDISSEVLQHAVVDIAPGSFLSDAAIADSLVVRSSFQPPCEKMPMLKANSNMMTLRT